MAELNCRHFNGYKPCGKNTTCDEVCPHRDLPQVRILLIHLGALGAVVRSTALLKPIKRKYPSSHITWITDQPAQELLKYNSLVDRVLVTDMTGILSLSALEFDVAFALDKSLKAAGVLKQTNADVVYGFDSQASTGAIVPVNHAAQELWEIGLSDHRKFFINKKSEIQLATEALELPYVRDDYYLPLSEEEKAEALRRKAHWLGKKKILIGFNTGCSQTIPYKKLSIEQHRELIKLLADNADYQLVLLGGKEDSLRNQEISQDLAVINSDTSSGLRDGLVSVEACDIVITGDSLGMHMAIGRHKWVVAWFGPTCSHEIELFDRGEVVLTKAPCAPCWKRTCQKMPMCYDQVDLNEIIIGVQKGISWLKLTSLSKQHTLATSY